MRVRQVQAKSGKEIRRYTQLVESYRRPDGMPATRVVASLGQLPERDVENLRRALAASHQGNPP